MVRLNKTQLSNDQLTKLADQLSKTFSQLGADKIELLLSELLGPEEKIMLAKRLAILILLLEGRSLYKISQILKVSPTTAEKIKKELDRGGFETLITILSKSKKDYFQILNTLDKILHLGGMLPHYNGVRRRKLN